MHERQDNDKLHANNLARFDVIQAGLYDREITADNVKKLVTFYGLLKEKHEFFAGLGKDDVRHYYYRDQAAIYSLTLDALTLLLRKIGTTENRDVDNA